VIFVHNGIPYGTRGELSASLLCSVEVTPSPLQLVLGAQSILGCTVTNNTAVSILWLHNASEITASQTISRPGDGVSVNLILSNIGHDNAGDYACRAASTAGALQTSGKTVSLLGK